MCVFLNVFQLTVLALFLVIMAGRTFQLRRNKGIRVWNFGTRSRGARRLVELACLVAGTLWCAEVVLYALSADAHILPDPCHIAVMRSAALRILGVGFVIGGLLSFLLALFSFGDSWRVGIDQECPCALVTTGVYAVSRNPIFLCRILYLTGTFLINQTLFFLISAFLVVIAVYYEIGCEERFLARHYGAEYRDYCARVGRFVTWPLRANRRRRRGLWPSLLAPRTDRGQNHV